MANQGVHYVDLVQWFGGPVRSVTGRINTFGHKIETEDLSNSLWTFESGAWASVVTTTCNTPGQGTVIEVSGDQGTLIWRNNKIELWETTTGAKLEDFSAPPDLPAGIIADMVSAITKGTKPAVDGQEGRKSVALLDATYRSAAEGREVAVQ
jgi:predicted dehydrogenase